MIALENLSNKRVLELGAGCGLAGIAAAKYHQLSKLISTDFDFKVLEQLRSNFELNFGNDQEKNWQVEYCDWTNQESVNALAQELDLIIAAGASFNKSLIVFCVLDVIYDPDLLTPFVQTLEMLTATNTNCRILIAGQERNPETLQKFLAIVGEFL